MDIFGEALSDYYYKGRAETLWLHNSYAEPEEMPVDVFFRTEEEMPELELLALEYSRGKILDIGAGVGSHALMMQKQGRNVTALEQSTQACLIMKTLGVNKVINDDIFAFRNETFDTLLLLMNGIGLCGTIEGLHLFLNHARHLLNPAGQIIFDSSDIAYLYQDGDVPEDFYYGEIAYQYEYKGNKGPWFRWLYADWRTIADIASTEGFNFRLLHDDGQDQYLASLELKK
ncbi:class I SAM-dependent methyltransferase [Arcticibacter tournemirensis]|uniref:class I SAM-dependent methyltransferase n=1 Tax=Arcticibacter tournemirensis TaxID=699437 RepID=UPI00192A38A9|nr:class I SAM-dependent methyltransferase [Arcticibacter tournemirensis]